MGEAWYVKVVVLGQARKMWRRREVGMEAMVEIAGQGSQVSRMRWWRMTFVV